MGRRWEGWSGPERLAVKLTLTNLIHYGFMGGSHRYRKSSRRKGEKVMFSIKDTIWPLLTTTFIVLHTESFSLQIHSSYKRATCRKQFGNILKQNFYRIEMWTIAKHANSIPELGFSSDCHSYNKWSRFGFESHLLFALNQSLVLNFIAGMWMLNPLNNWNEWEKGADL